MIMKKALFVLPALALLLAGMIFVGCAPSEVDPPPPVGEGILGGNLPSDGKIGFGIVDANDRNNKWNGSEGKALSLAGNPGGVGFGVDIVAGKLPTTPELHITYKSASTMNLLNPPGLNGYDTIPGQENDERRPILMLKGVTLAITKDNARGESPGEDDFIAAKTVGDIELQAHWWGTGAEDKELEYFPVLPKTFAWSDYFSSTPTLAAGHWTIQLQYDSVEVLYSEDQTGPWYTPPAQ
jgi:hypothetical protein